MMLFLNDSNHSLLSFVHNIYGEARASLEGPKKTKIIPKAWRRRWKWTLLHPHRKERGWMEDVKGTSIHLISSLLPLTSSKNVTRNGIGVTWHALLTCSECHSLKIKTNVCPNGEDAQFIGMFHDNYDWSIDNLKYFGKIWLVDAMGCKVWTL